MWEPALVHCKAAWVPCWGACSACGIGRKESCDQLLLSAMCPGVGHTCYPILQVADKETGTEREGRKRFVQSPWMNQRSDTNLLDSSNVCFPHVLLLTPTQQSHCLGQSSTPCCGPEPEDWFSVPPDHSRPQLITCPCGCSDTCTLGHQADNSVGLGVLRLEDAGNHQSGANAITSSPQVRSYFVKAGECHIAERKTL